MNAEQIVENDLVSGKLNLSKCSLLGVDEAHRAVGDYAYVYVAKQYMRKAAHPLVLGITASPGSNQEKIQEVCTNLSIQHVETRLNLQVMLSLMFKKLILNGFISNYLRNLRELKPYLRDLFRIN